MKQNLVIVTSEKSFYGSLDGLPPHICQMIAHVFYEPEISDTSFQTIRIYITENHIDGVIARGSWAAFLESKLEVTVFPYMVDAFDLISNIDRVMKMGYHRIGLFGHLGSQKCAYHYGTISQMKFGDNACCMSHIKTTEEGAFILERMISIYHIEVAIGDVEFEELAHSHGLPFFSYRLGAEFLARTIENAESIIEVYENQRRHTSYLETLTNIISECSIITDTDGNILFSNQTARAELFGGRDNVTHMQQLLPEIFPLKEQSNRIVRINSKAFILNVLSAPMNGKQNFSILLSSTKQIESTEMSIRRQASESNLTAKYCFDDIVYADPTTARLIQVARRYAASDATVLITGKSGTGKEMFASSIHNESSRREAPFVAINCATLKEELIESELFGYEKGAFTGALSSGKRGLFELAHKGTIFLDEIGELSIGLQAKLLRVLQEHEVRHLGGSKNIPIDTRVIAATNKNLMEMVQNGTFREDLYYRLSLLEINLPSLHDRPDDIIPLFKYFIMKMSKRSGRKIIWDSDIVFLPLLSYSWPGNIRELQNIAERTVLLSDTLKLNADFLRLLLPIHIREPNSAASSDAVVQFSMPDTHDLNNLESCYIAYLLNKFHNDKDEVCRYLNISRPTLWRKLNYTQNGN